MNFSYYPYNLPFKYPFTISRGTKTHQPTLIVELDHFGIKGYGEAPAISYYHMTVEKMVEELELKRSLIENFAFTEPLRYWHYLHHLFPTNNFLVCALDIAAWDLYGKIRKLPIYKLWGLTFENVPLTDYTIGIDDVEKMIEKLKEKPWPVYKIKLGTTDDIKIITALRNHTRSLFRVDANSAWTADEALDKIPSLKKLGVEFIEQPLDKNDWRGMKLLYEKSEIPLIADESCVMEADVEKCAGYFHGINIKLTKCGGITPAKRMIDKARKLNLKVMMGSMNETSIGSAAIAHFLPMIDYVDMDGPLLLDKDVATGLTISDGVVAVSGKPGLGIEFIEPSKSIL